MTDVVSLGKHRFDREMPVSPIEILREVIRRIEADELNVTHLCVVTSSDIDDDTYTDVFSGGNANRNERIGLLFRAANLLL